MELLPAEEKACYRCSRLRIAEIEPFRIGLGAALLRGGRVEVTWERIEVPLSPNVPDEIRQALLQGDTPLIYQSREAHEVVVDGHTYHIGMGLSIDFVAKLESIPADWAAAGTIPDGVDLVFVPGSTNSKAYAKLVQ